MTAAENECCCPVCKAQKVQREVLNTRHKTKSEEEEEGNASQLNRHRKSNRRYPRDIQIIYLLHCLPALTFGELVGVH